MISNLNEKVVLYEWDTIQVLAGYTVATEFSDYAPASTAFMTTQNFSVGSTIWFKVDHVSGPGADGILGTFDDTVINLDGSGHDAWYITDGGIGDLDGVANGSITTSWYVNPDDSLGATFLLSAQAINLGLDNIAGSADDVFMSQSAYASFTDSAPIGDIDLRSAGSSVTINGAIFFDSVNIGSGTGNYDTFLAIRDNDGNEAGFNSDDTPQIDSSNSDIDHAKTHTVLLSTIPIIVQDGVEYYEFRVDLNENNSNPDGQISLDTFKIYMSSSSTIESLSALTAQNLVYDMDAGGGRTLLLSEVSTGSGRDDYAVLVPVSKFSDVDPSSTYMYLYVQMGFEGGDYAAQAGFEEWSVQQTAGALTGVKFNDMNGDGTRDLDGIDNMANNADDEVGVEGVTIFIDSDIDGVLDVGERSTLTNATGHYTFFGVPIGTYRIDEVLPVLPFGVIQTTGDYETAIINVFGQMVTVDSIGNFYSAPSLNIVKEAVADQLADMAGEVLNYNISVENTGNVTLTNILVTDPNADAAPLYVSGDLDTDGKLDVGETWLYSAKHTLTQDEIDSNGGGDGYIDNTAIADSFQTEPSSDSVAIAVLYNPSLNIVKSVVSVDLAGDRVLNHVGEIINYSIMVQNTGNVTLTGLEVTDTIANVTYVSGNLDNDTNLDVGETWLYSASYAVTLADFNSNGGGDGDIDNTATADSKETDPLSSSVSVPIDSLVLLDPRTPGFWANWKTYWDGDRANDPKQVGAGDHDASLGFAEHDVLTLLYTGIDDKSTAVGIQVIDPLSNTAKTGLLIGDWNTNGVTDNGERTIFLSLQDASDILNASTKLSQDMQYVLGRDVVATWLNHLSGATVATTNPSFASLIDVKDVLNEAIDWLHATAGASGNPKELSKTAASSAAWNVGIDGSADDISAGNTIHQILDGYNNTGNYIVNPVPPLLYIIPE